MSDRSGLRTTFEWSDSGEDGVDFRVRFVSNVPGSSALTIFRSGHSVTLYGKEIDEMYAEFIRLREIVQDNV